MKNNRGITLIALIITVILMLMLVGVVVTNIRDGGLFNHAKNAVKSTEIASEKDVVQQASVIAITKGKNGKLTEANFQSALNSQLGGEGNAIVYDQGDTFVVEFTGTNRYYEIDNNGNVGDPITLEPIENAGDITKGGQYNGQTKETAYRIECIEDLVELSKNVNTGTASNGGRYSGKYIVLTKNLDFNSIFSYADFKAKYRLDSSKNAYIKDETATTTIKELCTSGIGFIPITNGGPANVNSFQGAFDGQNFTISNIYINRPDGTTQIGAIGLFGKIHNATIKNLTVDGLIKGKVTGGNGAGGIAGSSSGTSYIINCINRASVEGTNCPAGGIISGGNANITMCTNEGIVKSIGGIAFGIGRGTINKCVNKGNIIGEGAARVYGIGDGTPKNSYNIADIYENNPGAAAGISNNGAQNCYNKGNITCKPSNIRQYGGPAGISGGAANRRCSNKLL